MNLSKIYAYFGIVVATIFIGMGISLIYTNIFNNIPSNYRVIFATVFIIYGIFRLAMMILKIRNEHNYDNDED